jgi:hypothetical protein
MSGRVVMLEMNELCPPLLQRFMNSGELPNFSRLYAESDVFVTDAGEDPPNLEPWIQWVTVHTGLPLAEHGVFHLGDSHKLQGETLTDLAVRHDKRVWLCGSMNIRVKTPLPGGVLPDPWNTNGQAYPEELVPAARFFQLNVQEHTNAKVPLSPADYVKAAAFFATHGMSLDSVLSVSKQLAGEARGGERYSRALIVDRLFSDVFEWYYKKLDPHFATLFLNTVAHFQHKFWRNMEPDKFELKPTDEEQSRYKDAVLTAHKSFDRVIGRVLATVTPDTTIILCTALSQQPYLKADASGGKRFYRPHTFDALAKFAEIRGVSKFLPVMSEQFHIFFDGDEVAAREAEKKLCALRVGDRPALEVERRGAEIFTGCKIHTLLDDGAVLESGARLDGAGSERSVPFFDVFYRADSIKSGFHHRDGALWIRRADRRHVLHEEKVPLLAVAPTILDLLGLPSHPQMKEPSLFRAKASAA